LVTYFWGVYWEGDSLSRQFGTDRLSFNTKIGFEDSRVLTSMLFT